jgi:uncharacterized protein (DUF1800 family)
MKFAIETSLSRFSLSLLLLVLFIVQPVAFAQSPAPRRAVLTNDQRIRQVLSRLTFGARPGDVERVRKVGINAFIEQQLDPGSIDDSALDKQTDKLRTLNLSTPSLLEQYISPKPATQVPVMTSRPSSRTFTPNPVVMGNGKPIFPSLDEASKEPDAVPSPTPAMKLTPQPNKPQQIVTELQRSKLLRAVYSERQLNEVIVDFWENHFSIFVNKNADRWLMTSFDRESVRPFVMGRFRDLLGSVAHSPAMLYYLDNWQSSVVRNYPASKDKPARQSGGINENYARELMELHTLGVNGGYTQQDVQEVARCFTGWTVRKPEQEGTFLFDPAMHDNGEKLVLGQKIPAGGGMADAERVLDILARHPSTARFIAKKLASRFLGDDPPAAAIEQAARVFTSTDGSIRETIRSIITSPAFFNPALYQSKVRSPFEFVAAALRISGAKTDAGRPLLDWIGRMGQPLFSFQTPEGYSETGADWLSNHGLLTRLNFTVALVSGQIKGTTIDPRVLLENTGLNDPVAVNARLLSVVLMNDATPPTKRTLNKMAANAVSKLKMDRARAQLLAPGNNIPASNMTDTPKRAAAPKIPDHVIELIILTLGTPEFQRK